MTASHPSPIRCVFWAAHLRGEQPHHGPFQVAVPKAADVDDNEAEPEGGGLEDCLCHSILPRVVVVDAALNGWEDHLKGVYDEVGQPQEDAKQPCPVASHQGHLQAGTSGQQGVPRLDAPSLPWPEGPSLGRETADGVPYRQTSG